MSAVQESRCYRLDPVSIGARISRLRRDRGWSQAGLAARIGAHASVIGLIETGRRLPTREQVIALSAVLRRSMEHLLFGLPRRGALHRLEPKRRRGPGKPAGARGAHHVARRRRL